MLAGRAPRIILLSLDRQTPFSRRPSIHQGGICPTVFPSPSLLNCGGSLTCSFSLPCPPSACSLGAAFARGRSEQSDKDRLRIFLRIFFSLVLISCQVCAMFCIATWFSSPCLVAPCVVTQPRPAEMQLWSRVGFLLFLSSSALGRVLSVVLGVASVKEVIP